MKSKIASSQLDNSFIDPRATRWANATWLISASVIALAYLLWPSVQPIDYGNGAVPTPGAVGPGEIDAQVLSVKPEAKTVKPPMASDSAREVQVAAGVSNATSPEKAVPNSGMVSVASTDDQPENTQKTTENVPEISPPVATSPQIPLPKLDASSMALAINTSKIKSRIVAGETAPHYALESIELSKRLAKDFGGRFLVTDRNISIDIGRDLKPSSPHALRMVGQAWHEQYANRMVPLRAGVEVERALMVARQRFPQLGANASVYLSVPHSVDLDIYAAQRECLGEAWDVSCVTIMQLRGNKFEVLSVLPGNS